MRISEGLLKNLKFHFVVIINQIKEMKEKGDRDSMTAGEKKCLSRTPSTWDKGRNIKAHLQSIRQ